MIKRLLDLTIAISALILLAPLMVVICILIYFCLGSPIFFTQRRPGLNAEIFNIYKFRSMSDAKDNDGNLLPDEERLSKIGALLRASSLDELPNLWAVLKGDMSIVGPRPLLIEYLPLYNTEQAKRHAIKPGLTGWAQVNGRNAISWEDKFKLDVWYVENQSLCLDIKIILLTIKKIIKRDGISETGQVTMSKFTGNNQ